MSHTGLSLEELIREQIDQGGLITRFMNNVEKTAKAKQTLEFFTSRRSLLDKYFDNFYDGHKAIVRQELASEYAYIKDHQYDKVENSYMDAKAMLDVKIRALAPQNPENENHGAHHNEVNTAQFHLPKFIVPDFSGDVLEWESFRDQFLGVLQRTPTLSNVHKLLLLQQHLKGDAAEMLKNTQVTENSFQGAWEDLQKRYGNKRILLTHHMNSLMDLPCCSKTNSHEIKRVLDFFKQTVRSFEALEIIKENWNHWLVLLLTKKLDKESRIKWETSQANAADFPKFDDLCIFLENWSQALESLDTESLLKSGEASTSNKSSGKEAIKQNKKQVNVTTSQSAKSGKVTKFHCLLCNSNDHTLSYCSRFKNLQGVNRFNQIKKLKLCYNCLKDHYPNPCPSHFKCKHCKENHHTLLHGCFPVAKNSFPNRENLTINQMSSNANPENTVEKNCNCGQNSLAGSSSSSVSNINVASTILSNKIVLLATAKIRVQSPNGKFVVIKALIDTGSDTSAVSEWVVQSLNLRRKPINTLITGVLCSQGVSNNAVDFKISSLCNDSFNQDVEALILPKITSSIPSNSFSFSENQWPHIKNLKLADPEFFKTSQIDLLLGLDVCGWFVEGQTIHGPPGTPLAHETPFGFVLLGPTQVNKNQSLKMSCNLISLENIDELGFDLRKFWELENVNPKSLPSPEELECEKHFIETHSRDPSGRYIVKLPISKNESINLGQTRAFAVKMLLSMEKRMERDLVFAEKYENNIEDLKSMGHMVKIPRDRLNNPLANYISHHGVFKIHDLEGRLRVVFHASHKTSTGFSLNSKLLTGPKLQADLWVILTKWRFFKVVFTTDIVKMFRQIKVSPEDWDWQRIVWRDKKTGLIEDYWITVVMFGQACSPFLALRCKNQLVIDEGHNYPLASISLQERSYVDDIFEGADNLEEALKIKNELVKLLSLGGFPLAKWSSNHSDLAEKSDNLNIKDPENISTLGVVWSPSLDCFNLKIDTSLKLDEVHTKRLLLSEIAKLFDPLGWFSPVVIVAKILIQDLWLLNLDWDDKLPENISKQWSQFRKALPALAEITIPRWVENVESSNVEFHCFADASERAYAAVIYVVITNENKKQSSLLISKTKVAPIKKLSIPRLELCAADLLVKLANKLIPQLNLKKEIKVFGWSDSSTVLTWLNSHPSRWKPFVSHKVADIQNSDLKISWHYVPTKSNPADVASRGISASELGNFSLWWKGPSWLEQSFDHWPVEKEKIEENKVKNEEKSLAIINSLIVLEEPNLFQKFSSLDKLLKVIAYCLRLINYKIKSVLKSLSPEELEKSLIFLTRCSQKFSFPNEYNKLKSNKKISNASSLISFKPFMDEHGCIRVGGRLRNSFLSFNEKHPFLIAKNTSFSKLLVRHAHFACLHGGQEHTRNTLLQRFWIVHGRSYIRSIIRKCVICTKYNAKPLQQLMGQIPNSRLKPEKPFLSTGVDYCGPFAIKASSGRGIKTTKGYICVFICLVTKAVHLEVVTALSTQAFLAAFERLISRRGQCSTLYSDNGTNFKGAETELAKMFSKASEFYKEVSHAIISKGTSWSFIPPSSPHFGGLWEAGVKSVKSHLRKIIGEQKLTYEEMSTFLCKVEACLNSRPLYPASNDPTDLLPLTPAHFLIGEPIHAYPEIPSNPDKLQNLSNKFKLITNMRDHFWNRWSKEYIHHLQQYNRWRNPSENVKIGDLVLLKDECLPATKWPMARVIDVVPGADQLVRVATIKTATGIYKRPIVKLIQLPVQEE